MRATFPLVLLLATIACAQTASVHGHNKGYVTTDVTPTVSLQAGHTEQVEVRFRVNPGYHVNSNKPNSELLIPTTVDFTPLEKIKAGKITYPAGQDFALQFSPKEKLSVYTGDIVTEVPIIAAKDATAGQYTLKGELHYQACNDSSCFPPKNLPVEITVIVKK